MCRCVYVCVYEVCIDVCRHVWVCKSEVQVCTGSVCWWVGIRGLRFGGRCQHKYF